MNYKRNLRIGVDGYTDNETVLDVYGNVNVSKNINVAGTITYEDVTNVDSIGLITARNGIQVDSGGINVSSGIVTAPAFTGFDYLQAPHGTTVNYSVTVAAKTAAHRYNGSGSGNGYVINGVESPFLTLTPGRTYRFTLSSSDMSSHPFRFYLEADRTTEYTTNVTSTSTYTEIVVTDTTPTALHYQCSAHGYMGNAVQINSNAVNTPYQIEGLSGANITGVSTFAGNAFFQSNVHLGDNDQLRLGDSNEFKVIHRTAGDSTITSSGAVYVGSSAKVNIASGYNTDFMARFTPAGSAELYNNYVKKFETTASGIDVTGHTETDTLNVSGLSTFQSHVHLGDDDELRFGASNDFKIVHDPNDCRFENSNGDIKFKNTGSYFFFDEDGGETLASFINDGAVNLYHAGSKKLETTGYGVTVFGTLQVSNDVNVVGVLTANRLYSNVYGEFTGGGISGTNITGTSLNISGISTLGTLQISSGIVTATSGVITYYGDGSNLTGTNFNGASKSVVKYIATDGQTTFVASYEIGYVDVYLNGVKLTADLYTSTSGTSIILNDGAAANDVIEIISFTFIEPSEADSANNIANKASSKYTATNGQTSFAATYEIGYVDVYLNGVKLTDDLYDATSGSAVILNDGAAAGDIVEIIAFTFHNFNVGIQSGGSLVGSAKTINFNGSGISSVTVSSGIATININGINPIVANIVF